MTAELENSMAIQSSSTVRVCMSADTPKSPAYTLGVSR